MLISVFFFFIKSVDKVHYVEYTEVIMKNKLYKMKIVDDSMPWYIYTITQVSVYGGIIFLAISVQSIPSKSQC